MKKIILFLFALVLLSTNASALTNADDIHRSGFALTGGLHFGYESWATQKVGIGGIIRTGWGLSDNFMLYFEPAVSYLNYSTQDIVLWDFQVRMQFFAWKGLYTSGSSGITFATVYRSSSSYFTTPVGYVGTFAIGYEIPITDKFFISPEVEISYRGINDNDLIDKNFIAEMFRTNFGWHF